MLVTNEILSSIVNCQFKAYLKNKNQPGTQTDYEKLYTSLKQIQIDDFQKKLFEKGELAFEHEMYSKTARKKKTLLKLNFRNTKIDITLDGIETLDSKSFIPVLVIPFEKVNKLDKLFLSLQAVFIHENFNLHIEVCKVVFGRSLRETKFKLTTTLKTVRKTIAEMNKTLSSLNTPVFFKNIHCKICEFQSSCMEKLRERDDLSLLAGLKPKEIFQKNNRGIFSVRQLSFSFRPKCHYRKRNFSPELKALAIRENKTFIQEVPKFDKPESEVFMDFEGIPDRNSIYLIGVVIRTNHTITEHSFWASNKEDEVKIFIQLFNLLKPLKNFTIYHYGSYETKALKNISRAIPGGCNEILKNIIENSVNLLNVFTHGVYPPTYSNTLKEIAQFLKFTWTDNKASGIQSTLWRYQWEINQAKQLKDKLVVYNIEDCRALMLIKNWLEDIDNGASDKQFARDIKSENIYKWGITNYITKDFEEVNSKAYFDYQREHIYLRSNKKTFRKNRGETKGVYNKVDRKISLLPVKCPFCRSKNLDHIKVSQKLQVDIAFMRYGIKKQVTLYYGGGPTICKRCKRKIPSPNMKTLPMYGNNLMVWSVNQKIQYKQSSESIINFLKDSLKINVSTTQMTIFKATIAQKYLPAYKEIILAITKSELIHIDETIARIKNIDGYVWVLANHDGVFHEFRETRETDHIKELLKNFEGVLVSDFYTGYDSLNCKQQKCLIHLIRDLNGDFLKHQLDVELKKIIIEFGSLLRSIISTIDKYGLRKAHLLKHKKDVNNFYLKVISKTFESEYALAYQKRFIKYRERLFYFLERDNIPWNNNNAEHSIKPFAKWRKKNSKNLTKKNIEDHLILLSILQTCKYRNINFFEFLKSGETSIDKFSIRLREAELS